MNELAAGSEILSQLKVAIQSRIYVGHVMHERKGSTQHLFRYPVYVYALDLDELETLHQRLSLFSYNAPNIVSLRDEDYLKGSGSIRERLDVFLNERGLKTQVKKVTLVTAARYFNYVFNPVSFYYCYGAQSQLLAAVAEVNNTFGERHLYILEKPRAEEGGFQGRAVAPKDFHVSPFYEKDGDYDFYFSTLGDHLDIRINILKDGKLVFRSRLWGQARSLSGIELLKTLLQFPISASLTMPRILWQAAKLRYQKRLPVITKPYAQSLMTIQAEAPSRFQKMTMNLVFKFFERLRRGRLTLTLPDRSQRVFGGLEEGVNAEMTIGNYSFFRRAILGGDIGLGESYQEGEWSSSNLTAVVRLLGENMEEADDRSLSFSGLGRLMNRMGHLVRSNTISGSRRNIKEHYDLSNDLYALFLDKTWMYSSAVFSKATEDLETAQRRKIKMILEKAQLKPGMEILEIGSGWGSVAMAAAKTYGCKVTSITLSDEQLRLARERAKRAGLSDRVEFKICDYRDIQGCFDRVISIEMLEAVGHEFLGEYFNSVDRALRPDGLAVIQVITLPDQRYEAYRKGCDWIQKHIFPGAVCPSLNALSNAMTLNSSLVLDQLENIGPHYARTLQLWRERFLLEKGKIKNLGFDDKFIRTWDYYFSYCEAGFQARLINNLQLVLRKGARA
jgi:cyclopropane-fatty-acyl-phospholipid synthase